MKTGTCYFPSYGAALRYYRPYVGNDLADERTNLGRTMMANVRALVDQKLNEGEIHIGKPTLKPGETISIEDNRYFITEGAR